MLMREQCNTGKYIFLGAGKNSERYIRILSELVDADEPRFFVDNFKAGMTICGKPVIDFEELKHIYKDYTVLLTATKPSVVTEIASQLQSEGIPFHFFNESYCFSLLNDKIDTNRCFYRKYKTELDYMIHLGRIEMVPYSFRNYYLNQSIDVQYVAEEDLFYYNYRGKRLYFPRFNKTLEESAHAVRTMIQNLLTEQDVSSPHRYFTSQHSVTNGEIFVDIGAAEAMTSLEMIDLASKVYLFEGDKRWKKALTATFAPYREKVVIVDKYVGDHNDEYTVKIDSYFKEIKGSLFLKVDIEGNESAFLRGAEKTLHRSGTKISLCVYHKPQDAEEFMSLFQKWGYHCELSPGWLFVWGDFARGVMYGQLANNNTV